MFGGLGDIAGLMKSAKALQGNMAKMQEELQAKRYEADAGAGMVRATVDGKGSLVDIKIDPKSTGDVELLEDLIKGAVAAAAIKAQEAMKTEMSALTGGMDIPGMSELLGGGGNATS